MEESKTRLAIHLKPGMKMEQREGQFDPVTYLNIDGKTFCTDSEYREVNLPENFLVLQQGFDLYERARDGRLYFIYNTWRRTVFLDLDSRLVRKIVDTETGKQLWPK